MDHINPTDTALALRTVAVAVTSGRATVPLMRRDMAEGYRIRIIPRLLHNVLCDWRDASPQQTDPVVLWCAGCGLAYPPESVDPTGTTTGETPPPRSEEGTNAADPGFIVFPDDSVDEVSDDPVNPGRTWKAPGLYTELALAGYALTSDPNSKAFDGCIDLRTDGTKVTIFTTGQKPREHVLPADVAEVFLRWYRLNATEPR